MPEFDKEEFRKLFPKLSEEILGKSYNIRELSKDPLAGYEPNVYDFLCRVKSVEDGLNVIDYLERRGELSSEVARELRDKLVRHGIEAFGERREFGYYYRLASNRRREMLKEGSTIK